MHFIDIFVRKLASNVKTKKTDFITFQNMIKENISENNEDVASYGQ